MQKFWELQDFLSQDEDQDFDVYPRGSSTVPDKPLCRL